MTQDLTNGLLLSLETIACEIKRQLADQSSLCPTVLMTASVQNWIESPLPVATAASGGSETEQFSLPIKCCGNKSVDFLIENTEADANAETVDPASWTPALPDIDPSSVIAIRADETGARRITITPPEGVEIVAHLGDLNGVDSEWWDILTAWKSNNLDSFHALDGIRLYATTSGSGVSTFTFPAGETVVLEGQTSYPSLAWLVAAFSFRCSEPRPVGLVCDPATGDTSWQGLVDDDPVDLCDVAEALQVSVSAEGGGSCCAFVSQRCFTNPLTGHNLSVSGWFDYVDGAELWTEVSVIDSTDPTQIRGALLSEVPEGYVPTVCQYNVTTDEPSSNGRFCYLETKTDPALEIGMLTTGAIAGHETVTRRLWTVQQFENAGDIDGAIEGYPAGVELDEDGVPFFNGEHAQTTVPYPIYGETSGYGGLVTWEGFIHIPSVYHLSGNAGQEVVSFRLYDSRTSTTHGDRDELFIATRGGLPSLDRSDLTSVAVGQVGTSFTMPSAWAGQSTRIAFVHSDLGNASQVTWRAELTLANGDVLTNQDPRDWLWNENNPPPQIPEIQTSVTRTVDPITAEETWADANGDPVAFTDLSQPLQEVECGTLPLSFDVVSIGGDILVTNAAGGAGGPYEVSLDGVNWFPAPYSFSMGDTSDGTEVDLLQARPRIRDAAGTVSGVSSPTALVGDPADQSGASLRITDTTASNAPGAENNLNPDEPGGWVQDYGSSLTVDPIMTSLSGSGTGNVNVGTMNTNWIDINRQTASVGNVDYQICIPDSDVAAGADGTLRLDIQNYYYGTGATNVDITLTVVDQVTGAILSAPFIIKDNDNGDGSEDLTWSENALQNFNDSDLSFVGTGNPICLDIQDNTVGGDNGAHGWRIQNIEVWEGSVQSGTNHLWRNGSNLEARGIDRPETDPACITKVVDDVSESDLIRINAKITRVGTWNPDTDGWAIQISKDGGAWTDVVRNYGQWEVANTLYTNPFTSEAIDVADNDEIQLRWCVWGDGSSSKYARLGELTFSEVVP